MPNVQSFRSSKRFKGFPCTHRQWRAESHCRFVHGYSREFFFEFACRERTREGWVMDFGGLKEVKKFLEYYFDHTFLAAADDPALAQWQELDKAGILQLRVLPNPSMEGTAEWLYEQLSPLIKKSTQGRVWITKIEVRENENNAATFLAEGESP